MADHWQFGLDEMGNNSMTGCAQDHGVLAVIFSVLAMAFLFEVDDNLMEVQS